MSQTQTNSAKYIKSSPWVLKSKNTNSNPQIRLFCLPFAGKGASIYHNWYQDLPPEIAVHPIQLPGRENRLNEPLLTELPALIATLTEAIYPYLDRPFAFFGHSMGALISFELTRQIRRKYGLEPIHLFISGRLAPQRRRLRPPLHNLPEEAFIDKLRSFNGTPEAVLQNLDLMNLLIPILRADLGMCEKYTYQPEAPFNCPISCFGGLEDREAELEDLEGWKEHTSSSFHLRMLPGNHFFLLDTKQLVLSAVMADLRAHLCLHR
ncbi:putative thioesterase [Merismopedia glauca CCAP 1448/3]|uniref:Putative thioesterase n=2 Tax=Merismopedia TaxID=53402 RepID=A0A2T1C6Q1_9CYAN|nr:putative thioesterase [Merismopedia glauca CCAP 1448/3]